MTNPGDPPSHLELRGQELGITFTRGRTWTSNSHLALQAAEFAREHPQAWEFHRRMFKAYFEDLADIGSIDTIVRIADEAGLPAAELRSALEQGEFRSEVDQGIAWARSIGVSAVPTFVFGGRLAVVGAQPLEVFEQVVEQVLASPSDEGEG